MTRPLRTSLLANAAFSSVCGGALLLQPSAVAAVLGLPTATILPLIGVGLLAFAADLVHQATRARMAAWRALYASAADLLWVGSTFALLALFPRSLSAPGLVAVVGVAAVVFAFAAWQLWAIGRAFAVPGTSRYRHCVPVHVDVAPDAMWTLIGDLGNIGAHTPALRSAELLGGRAPGIGAVRRCEDRAGRCWSEEVVDFEAGRGFTVRFRSEAEDFPFPTRSMVGGWLIEPSGAGSLVRVWWELEPKPALLAPVLLPLFALRADRSIPPIVASMAAAAEGRPSGAPSLPPSAPSRRLQGVC